MKLSEFGTRSCLLGMICNILDRIQIFARIGTSIVFVSGIIQSPVRVHLLHLTIVLPLYLISQEISLMSTSHPALHNVTTDTNECDANPGTMCAVLAACGSNGRFNLAIWLELTISPFGSVTVSGVLAILLSTTGAVDSRKWLD